MRPVNVRDFTFRDLKLQVYILCPHNICYSHGLDLAIKAALPKIREDVVKGKRQDAVVLERCPGKPRVPWVVHPLWWSNTPHWDRAPFPWENPFLDRT